MVSCTRHPESPTVELRGVARCEACVAERLDTPDPAVRPAPGQPNPTVAAFLGAIPGVGAFYNGQYEKGVLHVLMFPMLIAMIHASRGFLGILVPFYFLYLIADAYKTALAKARREPLPDFLAFGALFGSAERPISAAFGRIGDEPAIATAGTGPLPAPENGVSARPPLAAIVLIVLGVLLLFGNLGWLPRDVFRTYWPLLLIVIGIMQARRRLRGRA